MPLTPTPDTQPTPLNYIKYTIAVLAALVLIPALVQGALAFWQTFVQTLVSIVLALNLLALSAIAAIVGIWLWQRRVALGVGSAPTATIKPVVRTPLEPIADQSEIPEVVSPQGVIAPQMPSSVPPEVQSSQDAANFSKESQGVQEVDRTRTSAAPDRRKTSPEPQIPLIQAQLARRLGVSASTIGARKHKPDFGEWSRQKDPAGLPWRYCEQARQFFVVFPKASA